MGQVTYIAADGTSQQTIELAEGESLMVGATSNGIAGIDGDCGGCAACATCHVHVDPAWFNAVGPAEGVEKDMLQFADGVADNSRLACQIQMRPELDGIVVRLPHSPY